MDNIPEEKVPECVKSLINDGAKFIEIKKDKGKQTFSISAS
jgi:hypothetical protein